MKPNVVSNSNPGAILIIAIGSVLFAYLMISNMGNVKTKSTSTDTYPVLINDINVVDIELENTEEYNITFDKVFHVNKGEERVCEITFLDLDKYADYVYYANNSNLTTLIKKDIENNLEYVFYRDRLGGDVSFKYAIKVEGLNYMPMLTSYISAEQATECFERIEFVVK